VINDEISKFFNNKPMQTIKPLFTGEKRGAHFSKHSKRKLIDAVFYIEKTGCQWRQLPHDFPKWSTVKSFYYRAVESGLWERMRMLLVEKSRVDAGRKANPTYGIIDSQSTKTMYNADEIGFDGGKKRKGESGI